MTEAEWRASGDPDVLLEFLLERGASERKLRLFACACCRRIWPLLTNPDGRHAVEVSERYADGRADDRELGGALALVVAASGPATVAAYNAASRNPSQTVQVASTYAVEAVAGAETESARAAITTAADPRAAVDAFSAALVAARAAEAREQVALLRDIMGNPFRPPAGDPAWRGGTAGRLARAIYDQRRFADLPVLADALEEAGCTDPEVLRHCRQPGPHALGCWVVDLVLGQE